MDPIFYTVRAINGDYADLVTDDGGTHSITMFLLPEGTTGVLFGRVFFVVR